MAVGVWSSPSRKGTRSIVLRGQSLVVVDVAMLHVRVRVVKDDERLIRLGPDLEVCAVLMVADANLQLVGGLTSRPSFARKANH
jgi:hypothetical protein